jgi:hypothetical protein
MLTIFWQSSSEAGKTMAPGVCRSISDQRFNSSWNVGSFGSVKIVEVGDMTSFSDAIFEVTDIAETAWIRALEI